MKNAKKSMKKMKNTDEEYECMQREYVGKNFQVKSESEKNGALFICKVTEGKMVMSVQIFTHWVT